MTKLLLAKIYFYILYPYKKLITKVQKYIQTHCTHVYCTFKDNLILFSLTKWLYSSFYIWHN